MPVPITIITGFLGAGKTTIIRKLLKAPHGLRIGLILNEIGQAGIDQVPEAELAYRELTEGCACCVRNPELIAALREVGSRGDLDRIILETSGLADPLPITWSLRHPELASLVALDAVVVVLDARHHADAGREEWEAQVRGADVAVITKRDLAPELDVRSEALKINPQLRFLDPDEGEISTLLLDAVADEALPRMGRAGEARSASGIGPHAVHSNFGGFIVAGSERYRMRALEDLLEALPTEVFRAKGIVPTDEGWVSFHVVGGRVDLDLEAKPPSHGEGRIALFGRKLDEPRLRALLAACVLEMPHA